MVVGHCDWHPSRFTTMKGRCTTMGLWSRGQTHTENNCVPDALKGDPLLRIASESREGMFPHAVTRAQHRLCIIETKQSVAGTSFFRFLQSLIGSRCSSLHHS
eukprot:1717031-Rhodomonas_salina.1